ncbi:MAG: type II secretion system protein GspJ [Thermodesulfobacteriota bacterium]
MHLKRGVAVNGKLKVDSSCAICRRPGGFTLIELLIAVAILAVVVTAIYTTLFNVLSTRENLQDNMDSLRAFRRFSASFTREARASFMSPANSVSLWNGTGGNASSHTPASLSMTFFTYSSGHERSGDLMAVSYSAEETEEGMSLYRESWNPYTGQRGFRAKVMEDILGFSASFYDGEKWVDSWDGTGQKAVPAAVSLIIDIKGLGGVKTFSTTVVTMVH